MWRGGGWGARRCGGLLPTAESGARSQGSRCPSHEGNRQSHGRCRALEVATSSLKGSGAPGVSQTPPPLVHRVGLHTDLSSLQMSFPVAIVGGESPHT